jgi:signal transduction histidine kinase
MKKPLLICILTTFIAAVFSLTDAQPLRRLNSSSYNVNEGLLQSSISDMNFDGFGFMWLSFETGLQRYDGHNFESIHLQNGLPANENIKFIKSKNGMLWLCHSKGISVYNATNNRFSLVFSFASKAPQPAVWPVNEDAGVVYFYTADGYITGINENTFHIVSRKRFPFTTNLFELPEEFQTSGTVLNHEVMICFDQSTLVIWDLQKGIAASICRLPPKISIPSKEFYALNNNECVFFINGQLNIFNIQKKSFTSFKQGAVKWQTIDGVSFEHANQQQLLMSVNNRLFQLNTQTMQLTSQLVNFQNQPFAHFAIRYIRFDNFGNIYLITRNEGLVKLLADTYPVSYYGTPQKEYNFITSLEVDKKNNRILAGGLNSGLLVFDTLQHLQQHIGQIGAFQKPGPLTISGIIHLDNDSYLLFPRQNAYCVLWNAISGKFKNVPVKFQYIQTSGSTDNIAKSIAYYNSKIPLSSHGELVAIDQNFYEVNFSTGGLNVKVFAFTYRTKGLCRFKNFILSGTDDKLFFRDTLNYAIIKKIVLPGCGEIRCLATDNNMIYVGSNHGLYKLNEEGKIISVLTKQNGLPDDYIYSIALDNSKIWCSTNKGLIRIENNSSILHLKKEDGLQENEFNTNIVAQEEDGELFFGGVNGINSFYPDRINNINDSPKVVLTDIKVNDEESFKDSATWMIQQIHLPYNHNNLYFEFTALGKKNGEQYFYQYKMSNVDKNWIRSTDVRNARYLLPPGKYFFQLYAGDVYNENPKNIKTIEIIISSPFWKTWWFLTLMILFFVIIIVFIVRQYLNRKYQKELRALQLQNELQHERERISRDLHDNIGAQLSFISSSIDWVIDKNNDLEKEEELKQIKAINVTAKNAMVNLRETIWALHKDKITLQEFSDKLKVYIQNMLQLQPQLQFRAEEKIDKNFVLTPAEMLNIFRICQESVNNVMKHANASLLNLVIHSDENSFHICIGDNGIGFDSSKIPDEHYGLKNMRHRAMEANAKLSIKTEKGKGTTVEIDKYSK